MNQVAALVVFEMDTAVFAQAVVHKLPMPGLFFQRTIELLGFVNEVARGIERESFNAQTAGGLQQPAKRVKMTNYNQPTYLPRTLAI
ncbi:hypothetical protein LOY46_10685 [Pseudomonas sichuanensis]|nr:hypothetical protein [Pseudomonas sichuanensis]UVK85115.1 hypothetical protein LOY46_10685 [Pseudomonas sichuanensis]